MRSALAGQRPLLELLELDRVADRLLRVGLLDREVQVSVTVEHAMPCVVDE